MNECVECGQRHEKIRKGRCNRCYQRQWRRDHPQERKRTAKPKPTVKPGKPLPERAPIPEVVADFAYPDPHPSAPSGQRIAVYKCPTKNGTGPHTHLVSWNAVDENPGFHHTTCRAKTASGRDHTGTLVSILAPLPASLLSEPPEELRFTGLRIGRVFFVNSKGELSW